MGTMKASVAAWAIMISLVYFGGVADVVRGQGRPPASTRDASGTASSRLNGVYRIDAEASDKLYTVVAGVSSNLPFGEQQRFFIDLAVRLTPPDLLAVERRGRNVLIGSSRAPRVTLVADGVVRAERYEDGRTVRSRVVLEADKLTFTATGKAEDNFSFVIQSLDAGRRIRVTRRIHAAELSEPVVIRTIYNKVSDVARWDIYGETQTDEDVVAVDQKADGQANSTPSAAPSPQTNATTAGRNAAQDEAASLRSSLGEWIDATNRRAIDRQMTFYATEIAAFYLKRNVNRAFVRAEKSRAFDRARVIEIHAAEPEIIFQDGGRTAIMRFRKKYRIEGSVSKRGEVIQELRWRRTADGWKIFSERDVRVIS